MTVIKSLFLRWWQWVNYQQPIVESIPEVTPEPVPVTRSDIWEQVHTLALKLSEEKCKPLSVHWFDHKPLLYSDSLMELLSRLEMVTDCIRHESDADASWEARRRDLIAIAIPDYYYNKRIGYRATQEVMEILIEKVIIIHHLLVEKQYEGYSSYGIYLRRNFTSVMVDTMTLLKIHETEIV